MEEEGIVIGYKGDKALVRTERSMACNHCASASICEAISGGKEMVIEAENPVKARKGERVVVSVEEERIVRVSLITYLIPTLAFIVGILLGREATFTGLNREIASALGGFLLLILSFFIVRILGRRMEEERRIHPVIIKTIG